MEKIKSFIYLDNKKMYSLASQIFEGLVESYIEREKRQNNQEEQQSGPIGSGRKLADMIMTEHDKSESKFLHDYLYNLFEAKLKELNKIKEFSNNSDMENIKSLDFVKVKGKAIFNDFKEITRTLNEFNIMGEAISYIMLHSPEDETLDQIASDISNIKDRNQRKKAEFLKENLIKKNIIKFAEDNNLRFDQEFLNKLRYLLDYGLSDMLEVQIKINGKAFSTILDRNNLKEEERLLINKYSRKTEADITVLGYVTQTANHIPTSSNSSSMENFKAIFHGMIDSLIEVENAFTGKSDNEYIIDPIAVYVEL